MKKKRNLLGSPLLALSSTILKVMGVWVDEGEDETGERPVTKPVQQDRKERVSQAIEKVLSKHSETMKKLAK